MKIIRHKPIARGVTDLMYVGDDDAVEMATGTQLMAGAVTIAAMGLGLLLMYKGKTKAQQTMGTVLVAAPVAVELYLHSQGSCVMD